MFLHWSDQEFIIATINDFISKMTWIDIGIYCFGISYQWTINVPKVLVDIKSE